MVANPKSQICCRKNVFEYLRLLFFYDCIIHFDPKTKYFRSSKDYGLVHNETILYLLHYQEAYTNTDF